MYKKTAFTLIELLVVISIIALLMAILMPALGTVKKKALGVTCQSNLRQCGTLMTMFAVDHGGYFSKGGDPGGSDGTGINAGLLIAMIPYWKNANIKMLSYSEDADIKILLCPTSTLTFEEGGKFPYLAHKRMPWRSSYGLNHWIHNPGLTYPLRSKSVPEGDKYWRTPYAKGAAYAPLLLDSWRPSSSTRHSDRPPAHDRDYADFDAWHGGVKDFCLNRHEAHINCIFLDSSVRKVGLKELWELKWHKKWNEHGDPPPVWPHWMRTMKDYSRIQ
ncbi:MAG: type II secretion system protein [Planctomycetota bacterium]|jgi:prepilin-type N-terminal cleavage/methylation domain-containing protein